MGVASAVSTNGTVALTFTQYDPSAACSVQQKGGVVGASDDDMNGIGSKPTIGPANM